MKYLYNFSWEYLNLPSPGPPSTFSSPLWGKQLVLLGTWPSSSVSSSSSSPWWACSCLGKVTQTMWRDSRGRRCLAGTSLTSCTASWSCSGCSVESGSSPCGTACMSPVQPASPTSLQPSSLATLSSSTFSSPFCSAASQTWVVSRIKLRYVVHHQNI